METPSAIFNPDNKLSVHRMTTFKKNLELRAKYEQLINLLRRL